MEQGVKWAVRCVIASFALLTMWTGFWTMLASPKLAVDPRNARLQRVDANVIRGRILAHDEAVIATSDQPRQRQYVGPDSLAHTIGYVHPRYGKSGLELAFDKELLGLVDETTLSRFWADITGQVWNGWDIITTLDLRLQAVIAMAMADNTGAVVALDPRDGAIRAIYSSPGFHPDTIEDVINISGQGDSLFHRATLGQYPPGSVFKPLVMAAALESNVIKPDQLLEDSGSVRIGGREITNAGRQSFGSLALDDALAVSANTVFAELATKIGADQLITFARGIGLGERPAVRIPTAGGNLPDLRVLEDPAALAAIGIGQGELLVTPLQMAVAIATIANGGWRVTPHLVDRMKSPAGDIQSVKLESAVRKVTPGTAHVVREAMIMGVERGTAINARVPGLLIAGKTGTAEVGGGAPHAWFAGFAPARSAQIVIVVLVEHGGSGGSVAAPIAQQIFSYLADHF